MAISDQVNTLFNKILKAQGPGIKGSLEAIMAETPDEEEQYKKLVEVANKVGLYKLPPVRTKTGQYMPLRKEARGPRSNSNEPEPMVPPETLEERAARFNRKNLLKRPGTYTPMRYGEIPSASQVLGDPAKKYALEMKMFGESKIKLPEHSPPPPPPSAPAATAVVRPKKNKELEALQKIDFRLARVAQLLERNNDVLVKHNRDFSGSMMNGFGLGRTLKNFLVGNRDTGSGGVLGFFGNMFKAGLFGAGLGFLNKDNKENVFGKIYDDAVPPVIKDLLKSGEDKIKQFMGSDAYEKLKGNMMPLLFGGMVAAMAGYGPTDLLRGVTGFATGGDGLGSSLLRLAVLGVGAYGASRVLDLWNESKDMGQFLDKLQVEATSYMDKVKNTFSSFLSSMDSVLTVVGKGLVAFDRSETMASIKAKLGMTNDAKMLDYDDRGNRADRPTGVLDWLGSKAVENPWIALAAAVFGPTVVKALLGAAVTTPIGAGAVTIGIAAGTIYFHREAILDWLDNVGKAWTNMMKGIFDELLIFFGFKKRPEVPPEQQIKTEKEKLAAMEADLQQSQAVAPMQGDVSQGMMGETFNPARDIETKAEAIRQQQQLIERLNAEIAARAGNFKDGQSPSEDWMVETNKPKDYRERMPDAPFGGLNFSYEQMLKNRAKAEAMNEKVEAQPMVIIKQGDTINNNQGGGSSQPVSGAMPSVGSASSRLDWLGLKLLAGNQPVTP